MKTRWRVVALLGLGLVTPPIPAEGADPIPLTREEVVGTIGDAMTKSPPVTTLVSVLDRLYESFTEREAANVRVAGYWNSMKRLEVEELGIHRPANAENIKTLIQNHRKMLQIKEKVETRDKSEDLEDDE